VDLLQELEHCRVCVCMLDTLFAVLEDGTMLKVDTCTNPCSVVAEWTCDDIHSRFLGIVNVGCYLHENYGKGKLTVTMPLCNEAPLSVLFSMKIYFHLNLSFLFLCSVSLSPKCQVLATKFNQG